METPKKLLFILLDVLILTLLMALPAQAALLGERTLNYGMVGEDVAELQQELQRRGYYLNYSVDGIFGPRTKAAVERFQRDQMLAVNGTVGAETLNRIRPDVHNAQQLVRATHLVQRGDTLWLLAQQYGTTVQELVSTNRLTTTTIYIGQTIAVPAPSQSGQEQSSRGIGRIGKMVPWDEAKQIFAIYDYATVTDVATGVSFQVQRRGGYLHADVQPLTAADTAKMKLLYPQWSWARRAIVVSVDGQVLAASMNGMPHGDGAIKDNNFPGHFCIHFLGSRTHGTKNLDPAHQQAVRTAAGL